MFTFFVAVHTFKGIKAFDALAHQKRQTYTFLCYFLVMLIFIIFSSKNLQASLLVFSPIFFLFPCRIHFRSLPPHVSLHRLYATGTVYSIFNRSFCLPLSADSFHIHRIFSPSSCSIARARARTLLSAIWIHAHRTFRIDRAHPIHTTFGFYFSHLFLN